MTQVLALPLEASIRDAAEKLIDSLKRAHQGVMDTRVEQQTLNERLDVFGQQWNSFLLLQAGRDASQVIRDEKIAEHLVEIRKALGTNGSGGNSHG